MHVQCIDVSRIKRRSMFNQRLKLYTRAEQSRPTPDNRPDSDCPDRPNSDSDRSRFGTWFGFPAKSVSGWVGFGNRKQQIKPKNPTDPDLSGLSRYRTNRIRVGSRFGFPAKSVSGLVGIRSGRDGIGPMLTLLYTISFELTENSL